MQAGLRTGAKVYAEETVSAALARSRDVSKPEGVIVVTGSIFLVGEVMREMGMEG